MTNFAYNRNIPDAPNDPSVDQPNMRTNTNSIDDILAINHKSFNQNNGGLHTVVQFDANLGTPGLGGGVAAFYPKVVAGQSWPFWQNGAGEFQLAGVPAGLSQNGFIVLGNTLKLQWGYRNAPGGSGTINFPQAFNGNPYIINATLFRDSGRPVSIDSNFAPTSTQFRYVCDSTGAVGLYWFAIGAN